MVSPALIVPNQASTQALQYNFAHKKTIPNKVDQTLQNHEIKAIQRIDVLQALFLLQYVKQIWLSRETCALPLLVQAWQGWLLPLT
jgi:hypothetical protein